MDMQKVVNLARVAYANHFMRYLFVGFSTFFIDFGLLVLLHGILTINLIVATSVAYWTSIAYNFILNRWWTFSNRDNETLKRNIIGYVVLLALNYAFTVIFIKLASHHINYGLAKVLAVGMQICWTFPAYKFIIFAKHSP